MVFLDDLHKTCDVAQGRAKIVPKGVAHTLEFGLQLRNPYFRLDRPFDKLRVNSWRHLRVNG